MRRYSCLATLTYRCPLLPIVSLAVSVGSIYGILLSNNYDWLIDYLRHDQLRNGCNLKTHYALDAICERLLILSRIWINLFSQIEVWCSRVHPITTVHFLFFNNFIILLHGKSKSEEFPFKVL